MRIALIPILLAISASAQAAERRYTVTDFDRVQVEGPYRVTLATGRASGAVARVPANQALDRISIEVEGRLLRIRPNASAWGGYPGQDDSGGVEIALATHDLRSVYVRGSGSLEVDRARAMRLDISLSGSGRIAINHIDADVMAIAQVGAGSIALAGKAKSVRAAAQGAGELDASGLSARDVVINSATDGRMTIAADVTAKVTADGAGDVEIIGDPACTVTARGAGRIICGRDR